MWELAPSLAGPLDQSSSDHIIIILAWLRQYACDDKFIRMITPMQSRMARAALGWSTTDLAEKAQVGPATVNRFETQARVPIPATLAAIRRAFEAAGVVFSEHSVAEVRHGRKGAKK